MSILDLNGDPVNFIGTNGKPLDVVPGVPQAVPTGIGGISPYPYNPELHRPAVMTSPPSITNSGTNPMPGGTFLGINSLLVSKLGMIPENRTPTNGGGVVTARNATNGPTYAPMPYTIELTTDAAEIVMPYSVQAAINSTPQAWVWVDELPATVDFTTLTAVSDQNVNYLRIVFASAVSRVVRIELARACYGGLYVTTGSSVQPGPDRPLLIQYGDSYIQGVGGAAADKAADLKSLPFIAGRILGANTYIAGIGGTGYEASGGWEPSAKYGAAHRLNLLDGIAAPYMMIWGTINDDPHTHTAIKAGAKAMYADLAIRHPGMRLIIVGSEPTTSNAATNAVNITNNNYVRNAANEAPNVVMFFDSRRAGWITSANQSSYVMGHLTTEGNYYMGALLAEVIFKGTGGIIR